MSGGSYNYLYSTGFEKLRAIASSLEDMADKCLKRADGPAAEIWSSTTESNVPLDRDVLRRCGERLATVAAHVDASARLVQNLQETLRAVEWWKSGDSNEGDVVASFEQEMLVKPKHSSTSPHDRVRIEQLEEGLLRIQSEVRMLLVSGGRI